MKTTPEEIQRFLSHHKRVENNDSSLIQAAVLILLYPRNNEIHVLLTKRTEDVEHHKRQISFPGGSADTDDADIVRTALRETEEEVGIPTVAIQVLGLFNDSWTPTGFRITPVIGYISELPKTAINKTEVQEILEVPVSFFLDGNNERVKTIEREGKSIHIYFYRYGENEIWGATAGILRSFLRALKEFLAARDGEPAAPTVR